jgi:hypothetical protein
MKTKLLQLMMIFFLFPAFTLNAQVPARVGWWKFDNSTDLSSAEIGSAINIAGSATSVSGPAVGNEAAEIGSGSYLMIDHQISSNGGGSLVNEYTLQIDFSVPAIGIWHCFMQTDEANLNDGDLFASNSSNAIGVSATGYSSRGISVDTWYRMVVSVKNGEFFRVYLNGELWLEGSPQAIDGRHALSSALLLFADEDGEDGTVYCSEVGIWNVALDEDQVLQLGDASGDRARVRTRLGWWKFDDAADILQAEIGEPLVLVGTQESVPGPSVGNLATKIGLESYLSMSHGIGLNGEDNLVNEYSIQMDFSVPATGAWHAFFQTDKTNESDAELFTKNSDNTIGTAATGYSTKAISAEKWYRMVVSVKNGTFFKVYLNGELWVDAPGQDNDGRFGLDDVLLIFADNDGDDGIINCSELSIWEVALTESEVAELGYDPTGSVPARSGWWKFDDSADMLKAEIGSALELEGEQMSVSGPVSGNLATNVSNGSYLKMNHGLSGNGGGSMVNEYSLQLDFSIPDKSVWHSFIQTTTDNSNDADLFINNSANAIGTAATGYSSNSVASDTWYRMIISVKNGMYFKVYINGEIWLDAAGQALDDRFALADVLLIFADDAGDDAEIKCSELGIWDVSLNAEQITKLGDATTVLSTGTEALSKNRFSSELGQNYPNPFTHSTTFPYQIEKAGNVSFRILDMTGKEVKLIIEGNKTPGKYILEINSDKLNNGIYYLQMNTDQGLSTRKMVVFK